MVLCLRFFLLVSAGLGLRGHRSIPWPLSCFSRLHLTPGGGLPGDWFSALSRPLVPEFWRIPSVAPPRASLVRCPLLFLPAFEVAIVARVLLVVFAPGYLLPGDPPAVLLLNPSIWVANFFRSGPQHVYMLRNCEFTGFVKKRIFKRVLLSLSCRFRRMGKR